VAILTTDILIEGIRRDDVFTWLSDVANHERILTGAFDGMERKAAGEFDLVLKVPPRPHHMGYKFLRPDDSHGGRRVLCETSGKRTRGDLHYSLRTMKPSTNTLVTLRIDYDPGSILGPIFNNAVLSKRLDACLVRVLENMKREISAG